MAESRKRRIVKRVWMSLLAVAVVLPLWVAGYVASCSACGVSGVWKAANATTSTASLL